MRITILGGSGFVGHHLVAQLQHHGHVIKVLSRNAACHHDLTLYPGVQVKQANVYALDQLTKALEGSDAVINLVGILNEHGHDGSGFQRAHVTLVENLVQACCDANVRRLLHMSALCAGQGQSFYLRTRGAAEQIIRDAQTAGQLETTLFQPSVIFGRGDSFIHRFAQLLKFSPIFPLACPNARFQPVWVNDVANAFAWSLLHKESSGQTYQLGGPDIYTLRQIVAMIAQYSRQRRWIIPLPTALARAQAALLDYVPGKPFSTDNYHSLQVDSVTTRDGFALMNMTPTAMTTILPTILAPYTQPTSHQQQMDRYRRQYRQDAPPPQQ